MKSKKVLAQNQKTVAQTAIGERRPTGLMRNLNEPRGNSSKSIETTLKTTMTSDWFIHNSKYLFLMHSTSFSPLVIVLLFILKISAVGSPAAPQSRVVVDIGHLVASHLCTVLLFPSQVHRLRIDNFVVASLDAGRTFTPHCLVRISFTLSTYLYPWSRFCRFSETLLCLKGVDFFVKKLLTYSFNLGFSATMLFKSSLYLMSWDSKFLMYRKSISLWNR